MKDAKKVLIGIPAYNEEKNIGILLTRLVEDYPSYDILVVSSGSTDRTNDIVREMMVKHKNISLIAEKERSGKSSALNILLKELNKGYSVLVYLGADDLPERGSIDKLLYRLTQDEEIGFIGGKPVPVDDPCELCGWMNHIIWAVHHEISLKEPKVSGELCALRSGIVYEIPPTIINDDAYLQFVVIMKGYKAAYEPSAVVHNRGPRTIREFFNQRYRVTIGHYQVEQLLGAKLPTTYAKKNVLIAWKARKKVGFIKEVLWFLLFLMLSAVIVGKAWFDFYVKRKLPYKWKLIMTSKEVI